MSDVVVLSDCRSQGCRDWVRAGRPYSDSKPIKRFALTISGHGFTVYTYPDKSHLVVTKPEDHTPFSATGFPTPAPRWYGNAADVMPKADTAAGRAELAQLSRQVIADKDAGVPGTEWIKYLNWTDEAGDCWHVSWQTGAKIVTRSTDKGHLHISGLSTWVFKDPAAWDAVNRMHGSTGEDEDAMGASWPPIEIKTDAPTSIPLVETEGGGADPRPQWVRIVNETGGRVGQKVAPPYALRIMGGDGHGGWAPVASDAAGKPVELVKLNSNQLGSWQLKKGVTLLSVARCPLDKDGHPVYAETPTDGTAPYAGYLMIVIERGEVLK